MTEKKVEKTVKALAQNSKIDIGLLQKQLRSAGLGERSPDDLISASDQEKLVAYLQKSHGQAQKSRISLKQKTETTAKAIGSSGKAKTVNVIKKAQKTFEKPNADKIAQEIAYKTEKARLDAEQKQTELKEQEAKKKASEERQAKALEAMRASAKPKQTAVVNTASVVVKKVKKSDESSNTTAVKTEVKVDKPKKTRQTAQKRNR